MDGAEADRGKAGGDVVVVVVCKGYVEVAGVLLSCVSFSL